MFLHFEIALMGIDIWLFLRRKMLWLEQLQNLLCLLTLGLVVLRSFVNLPYHAFENDVKPLQIRIVVEVSGSRCLEQIKYILRGRIMDIQLSRAHLLYLRGNNPIRIFSENDSLHIVQVAYCRVPRFWYIYRLHDPPA